MELAASIFESLDSSADFNASDDAHVQGDDARFSALYRRFGPVIFARCRKLLRDPVLAEDATQEVFARVYRNLASAPDDGEILVWMYRISTNYCLSLLRRRAVRGLEVEPEPSLRSAEELMRTVESRDLLRTLVEALPEKLRAAAVLYFVDGMDQQQVADTLGISRRTVVTRLQRAQGCAARFYAREVA